MLADMSQTLSDRLKIARSAVGLSARKLSRLAGLADGHVAMFERGIVDDGSAKTMGRLAQALGVSLDWLVLGIGDGPAPAPQPDAEAA